MIPRVHDSRIAFFVNSVIPKPAPLRFRGLQKGRVALRGCCTRLSYRPCLEPRWQSTSSELESVRTQPPERRSPVGSLAAWSPAQPVPLQPRAPGQLPEPPILF